MCKQIWTALRTAR